MLVVIDGIDGVGKTSACRRLIEDYNYVNASELAEVFKAHINSSPAHSLSVSRLLNLALLQHVSDLVKQAEKTSSVVIVDRYIPSHKHYAPAFNREAIKEGKYLRPHMRDVIIEQGVDGGTRLMRVVLIAL